MKTDFYLHNNYATNEILENLREDIDNIDLAETLADSLYDFFYEVGFDIEYNEKGKITKVEMKKKL